MPQSPSLALRPTRSRAALLGVLALVLSGCATASNPFRPSEDTNTLQVEVRNQNFSDATVYALRAGQSIRLGVVSSQNFEVFSVRWPSSLPIRVQARFLGGLRCSTQEILVSDGDRITVELPANLALNSQCLVR